MTDPFGLMKFAECEHQQLKCEKCGARSDIRGWQTFTGKDKDMLELRDEIDRLTARLAAAEARSYDRIAEIDKIREQLANAREGDNWVLMARESIANGNCPWCFCMDEGPHQPGCYVNEIEAENSRLHRELCEMSEPRLKLHATIQQLAERLASAEALLSTACDAWECGQMVWNQEGVLLSDYKAAMLPRAWYEAAKGWRDE